MVLGSAWNLPQTTLPCIPSSFTGPDPSIAFHVHFIDFSIIRRLTIVHLVYVLHVLFILFIILQALFTVFIFLFLRIMVLWGWPASRYQIAVFVFDALEPGLMLLFLSSSSVSSTQDQPDKSTVPPSLRQEWGLKLDMAAADSTRSTWISFLKHKAACFVIFKNLCTVMNLYNQIPFSYVINFRTFR